MQNVEAQVIKITAETLGVEESKITPKSNFITDLGADSLDSVELMMAFEAAFGQDIPDEEAAELKTIEKVVKYIKGEKEDSPKKEDSLKKEKEDSKTRSLALEE